MRTALTILTVLAVASASPAQSCDPNWDTMDGGTNGPIYSMVRLPNNDIVVGGSFTRAGEVAANNIARWDGSSWRALADGMSTPVWKIRVRSTGNIVALGSNPSGSALLITPDLKEWDGTEWQSLNVAVTGSGYSPSVWNVFVLEDDSVVLFGRFDGINSLPMRDAARLVAGSWSQFGTPHPLDRIYPNKILQQNDGTLLAYGSFSLWGLSSDATAARFDGQRWNPVSNFLRGWYAADCVIRGDGTEYQGGSNMMVGSQSGPLVKRVPGTGVASLLAFDPRNGAPAIATMAALDDRSIFVGGDFPQLNGVPLNHIAMLTDDILSPLGVGTNDQVSSSLLLPDGQLVVAGYFTSIGNQPCGRIARAWPLLDIEITRQPIDQAVAAGSTATFSLQAVQQGSCPTPMALQWQRRDPRVADPNAPDAWIDLVDDGNFVNTTLATFSILNPTAALATGFRCRIQGCSCKNAIYSEEVNFSIACPADFNADGGVDFTDVEAFFERWENGC